MSDQDIAREGLNDAREAIDEFGPPPMTDPGDICLGCLLPEPDCCCGTL